MSNDSTNPILDSRCIRTYEASNDLGQGFIDRPPQPRG